MLLITISYHQLVKRQVSDLPFFACFHHFGEKFFASRHNSLRVVFVHIYPTRSFFLGRRKHELAVFVLSEFDHDGPGFRSGAARSVCPLDRHGAYLSFRKFQRCCHFSAHVFFPPAPRFRFLRPECRRIADCTVGTGSPGSRRCVQLWRWCLHSRAVFFPGRQRCRLFASQLMISVATKCWIHIY